MNSRTLLLVTLIVTLACTLTACRKKKNDNPFGGARIATLDLSHNGGIYHYHMVYDQYNNIDSIIYTGDGFLTGTNGFSAFNYFGSSYSVTNESNQTFNVYANTAGQVLQVQRTDTLFLKYNNNQLGSIDHKIVTTTPPYYYVSSTTFYWASGDVKFTVNGSDSVSYDYDLTNSGQPGDPFRITSFLDYGGTPARTVHLLKDIKAGGNMIEQYLYQFNGGKITQLKKVVYTSGIPPSVDTFTYDYTYY